MFTCMSYVKLTHDSLLGQDGIACLLKAHAQSLLDHWMIEWMEECGTYVAVAANIHPARRLSLQQQTLPCRAWATWGILLDSGGTCLRALVRTAGPTQPHGIKRTSSRLPCNGLRLALELALGIACSHLLVPALVVPTVTWQSNSRF